MTALMERREALHRRALLLEYCTVGWNVVEAVVAIGGVAGDVHDGQLLKIQQPDVAVVIGADGVSLESATSARLPICLPVGCLA